MSNCKILLIDNRERGTTRASTHSSLHLFRYATGALVCVARPYLLKEIRPFSVLFCRGDCYFNLGEKNPYVLGGMGHDLQIDPPRGDVTQGIRGHGGVQSAQPSY